MSENDTKIRPKQEAAVIALLENRTLEEAAKSIKVAPKTLYRWLKEPAFQAAVRNSRRDAYSRTIARLQHVSDTAANLLTTVIVDSNAPTSTRVRAAEIVLDKAARALELEDLEARITTLERASACLQQR
jgi:hypothetical protein